MDFIELIGDTLIITGEVLLAYTVIAVHGRIQKEHKVDDEVFKEMHREQIIGILSIVLLATGFVLRIIGRYIL